MWLWDSIMNKVIPLPAFRRILPDGLAFVLGLGAAWILDWKTTDLIWSLWLCSLVLGYLTILSTIIAGVYIGIKAISNKEFPQKHWLKAVTGGSLVALFFLGFFSIHFCGFHAGHAVFLSSFFPVEGMPGNAFGDAFMNPVLLWWIVFQYLVAAYGIFLIPAIIAERKYVFASIIKAVKAEHDGTQKHDVKDLLQSGKGRKKSLQDPFLRPYINVVRMHILIFFFAFCHVMKIESFFIYAVVCFVYFFPWKEFRTVFSHK
jgi:hypothetical protein